VREFLKRAGASFLRAFGGSLLVLLPGVLAAPNLNQALGLAAAASIASLVAALRVIQDVSGLSFAGLLPDRLAGYGAIVDSFARAFIGSVITLLIGFLSAPDLHFSKAALTALLIAIATALVRAIQGALTPGDVPAPNTGIDHPSA
jgi:hypothetical protein